MAEGWDAVSPRVSEFAQKISMKSQAIGEM